MPFIHRNRDCTTKPKRIVKRRRVEHALKNVISMRISDQEMESLAMVSRRTAKSISDIMRDAYNGWKAGQNRFCTGM